VVIIDTGPVLGSLEASLVATAADQVVLTVARGEQRPLIDRAIAQLHSTGADLAGIVLNRAAPADILSSGFSSSSRRSGEASFEKSPELRAAHHEQLRLGPIGSAVVALGDAASSALPPDQD
jgi:Mrp family chromosome partitioning ATPase